MTPEQRGLADAVAVLLDLQPAPGFDGHWARVFALCIAYRWAAVLLGLTLAATCVICAIEFLRDPNMGDNAFTGILFLPWAGFGLWLAAGGLSKKRGLPHDP